MTVIGRAVGTIDRHAGSDEAALVELARAGDGMAVRQLIRRYNQRLFRTARSIIRNDGEAEDVVQATYVSAFQHLDTFRSESRFSTWLTRIAVNEALSRLRRQRPTVDVDQLDTGNVITFPGIETPPDPEVEMSRNEVRAMLEAAVDRLPSAYRTVFVLRDVDGQSVEETATLLSIRPETVRTRLFRARRLLREMLEQQVRGSFTALFPFAGVRCEALAERVLEQLAPKYR